MTGRSIDSVSDLPNNWINANLSEIATIVYGKGLPTNQLLDDGYSVFGANGIIGYTDNYMYENQEVLISCRGAYSGKVNISPVKCHVTNNSLILQFNQELYKERKFYYYILQSIDKSRIVTGSAQPQVTINNIKDLTVPLPPLPEQHRIVAKIEELFTKLDAGVEALKKTKALLKKYRQSVIKAAVEGKLTEEWRKKNGKRIEPASVLLERIQVERKERLGKNYKPPKPIDTTNLPDLPEGWVWAEMGQLIEWSNGKGLTHKDIISGPHNVYGGNGIIGTHNKFLSEQKCIVVGRVGAYCGNVNIASNKSWITDNAIYSKWISKHFEISYSKLLLTSLGLNNIAGGSGQPYVKQSLLNPIIIPLPSISEQNQIVIEIERLTSIIDESEQIIDAELKRSQSLRQSILKRAFEGKLVPQDPNDLPASDLLERIKNNK